ncbi:hypothetical protein Tco_0758700 [Tanacetum coccineum]
MGKVSPTSYVVNKGRSVLDEGSNNGKSIMVEDANTVKKVVDKGKSIMVKEDCHVHLSVCRNNGIVIQDNVNPSVVKNKLVDYLSSGEDELIELRKRTSEAKNAPKLSLRLKSIPYMMWTLTEGCETKGSTVKVGVTVNPDDKTYFDRFYVCFKGLKYGWKLGCRKIIALDSYFLKTPSNKDSWSWFLDLLGDDLEMPSGNGLTLMSDQHKAASNATYPGMFNKIIEKIKRANSKVYEYLLKKEPKTCSRAYFHIGTGYSQKDKTEAKTDKTEHGIERAPKSQPDKSKPKPKLKKYLMGPHVPI